MTGAYAASSWGCNALVALNLCARVARGAQGLACSCPLRYCCCRHLLLVHSRLLQCCHDQCICTCSCCCVCFCCIIWHHLLHHLDVPCIITHANVSWPLIKQLLRVCCSARVTSE
jgi:hypothetical protein